MKYEDFEKFIQEKCMYETIYDDSDGRQILVIKMLDAYGMANKAQREWVGLTKEELSNSATAKHREGAMWAAAKLKEKNT
jgi:hypothetical protein